MEKIVYTANIGNYDTYKPINMKGFYYYFTDQTYPESGWTQQKIQTPKYARLESRKYKSLPHKYFPESEWTMWADSSFQLTSNPWEFIEDYLDDYDYITTRHPVRETAGEENKYLYEIKKYPDKDLKQIDLAFENNNLNLDAPLIEGGIQIRRNTTEVNKLNEEWFNIQSRYKTPCDQAILAALLDKYENSIRIKRLNFQNSQFPFLKLIQHHNFTHYERPL